MGRPIAPSPTNPITTTPARRHRPGPPGARRPPRHLGCERCRAARGSPSSGNRQGGGREQERHPENLRKLGDVSSTSADAARIGGVTTLLRCRAPVRRPWRPASRGYPSGVNASCPGRTSRTSSRITTNEPTPMAPSPGSAKVAPKSRRPEHDHQHRWGVRDADRQPGGLRARSGGAVEHGPEGRPRGQPDDGGRSHADRQRAGTSSRSIAALHVQRLRTARGRRSCGRAAANQPPSGRPTTPPRSTSPPDETRHLTGVAAVPSQEHDHPVAQHDAGPEGRRVQGCEAPDPRVAHHRRHRSRLRSFLVDACRVGTREENSQTDDAHGRSRHEGDVPADVPGQGGHRGHGETCSRDRHAAVRALRECGSAQAAHVGDARHEPDTGPHTDDEAKRDGCLEGRRTEECDVRDGHESEAGDPDPSRTETVSEPASWDLNEQLREEHRTRQEARGGQPDTEARCHEVRGSTDVGEVPTDGEAEEVGTDQPERTSAPDHVALESFAAASV